MKHLEKIEAQFGYIDIFSNEKGSFLYVVPHGYVGPSLVKRDLDFAQSFDNNCNEKWTYIVDTSKVTLPNPINVFYLRRIKNFKKMEEYVVYAPSRFVRIMLWMSSWVSRPDRVVDRELGLLAIINEEN